MQNFKPIQQTDTLQNSREIILENDQTILSCSSGPAFPSSNLQVGMLYLDDVNYILYQLKEITPAVEWLKLFEVIPDDSIATDEAFAFNSKKIGSLTEDKIAKLTEVSQGAFQVRNSDPTLGIAPIIAVQQQTSEDLTTLNITEFRQGPDSGVLKSAIRGDGSFSGKADTAGTADVATTANSVAWADIEGTPATFPPSDTSLEMLNKIKLVDGINSGLDADLFRGQNDSYYKNASNLNAGTIPRARLPYATTSANGAVQFSTNSESIAGVSTSVAVTPASLVATLSDLGLYNRQFFISMEGLSFTTKATAKSAAKSTINSERVDDGSRIIMRWKGTASVGYGNYSLTHYRTYDTEYAVFGTGWYEVHTKQLKDSTSKY